MVKSNRLSDTQLGVLTRRWHEVMARARKGGIGYMVILAALDGLLALTQKPAELREGEYAVYVETYVVPGVDELKRQFDVGWWEGHGASGWEDHASREGADAEPGERIFFVKQFSQGMTSDEVIAWANANGYYVANRAESLAYAKAFPNRQRNHWIVALGSSVPWDGPRRVTVLNSNSGCRSLGTYQFTCQWAASDGFLLVRK